MSERLTIQAVLDGEGVIGLYVNHEEYATARSVLYSNEVRLSVNKDIHDKLNAALKAAALNASAQREDRSEVHWTALKCSLEICEHDNATLRKLLARAVTCLSEVESDCQADSVMAERDAILAEYAALQTEENDVTT